MADLRSDITRWLLNAEDAAGDDKPAQIAWLRTQRIAYAAKAGDLDWEITNDSFEGASTAGRRGTSNRAEHDAIVGAIDKLKAQLGTGGKTRGTMLGFRINHITG